MPARFWSFARLAVLTLLALTAAVAVAPTSK